MKWLSSGGVYAVFAIVCLSWFLRTSDARTNRIAVYTAALASVLSILVAMAIQHVYQHDRPFVVRSDVVLLVKHSADTSFPSEHTTIAVALAAGLGVWRAWPGAIALAIAVAMGFARVYVGIHYPADIAGGIIVGGGAALVAYAAHPLLEWLDATIAKRTMPSFLLR